MTVNIIGVGLIVLGMVLLVVTTMFWRAAVEDPEVLAPLEVMADRRFARADDTRRRDLLNEVRPSGAAPVTEESREPVLMREPVSEPERPFRDPFPHDDDAVDVVPQRTHSVPQIIDPLLNKTELTKSERRFEDDPSDDDAR